MRIVLATKNPGKALEFNALLQGSDITIIPQSEFDIQEIPENGLTYVENAIAKARHVANISKLPVIADDSGLEVAALNNAPGIYSARFAGSNATAAQRIDKLLHELKAVPDEKRNARFQCVMVYMKNANDATPIICQGTWHGKILQAPEGTNGFGYDPIFFVPTHNCSAANLPLAVKNKISHRGQALLKMLAELTNL